MAVTHRDNMLARWVSSRELGKKKKNLSSDQLSAQYNPERMIQLFEESARAHNKGVQAAIDANFTLQYFSFADVTAGVCSTVGSIDGQVFGTDGVSARDRCKKVMAQPKKGKGTHVTSSNVHAKSLEQRVGRHNAEVIKSLLRETSYEWMLDLSSTTWPSNLPRPINLIGFP